jgi:hypothetical protein
MDPHSIRLFGPDPLSKCGSRSRRIKISKNKKENLVCEPKFFLKAIKLLKNIFTNTLIEYEDPDPHWIEKLYLVPHSSERLDLDPQEMSADPKKYRCIFDYSFLNVLSIYV